MSSIIYIVGILAPITHSSFAIHYNPSVYIFYLSVHFQSNIHIHLVTISQYAKFSSSRLHCQIDYGFTAIKTYILHFSLFCSLFSDVFPFYSCWIHYKLLFFKVFHSYSLPNDKLLFHHHKLYYNPLPYALLPSFLPPSPW